MGQKVNPIGYRLGINQNWKSNWFAKGRDFAKFVLEDCEIRQIILQKTGPQAAISEINIEREIGQLNIAIHTARPGILIGRSGKQLENLRAAIAKKLRRKFKLDVVEVKKADLDAAIVAQTIGMQIAKRMPFRRVAKQAVQRVMSAEAKGVRITVSGRLGGIEIARSESFTEGSVSLSTLRNDISFSVYHSKTNYGVIGVKVWINLGEKK